MDLPQEQPGFPVVFPTPAQSLGPPTSHRLASPQALHTGGQVDLMREEQAWRLSSQTGQEQSTAANFYGIS